MVFSASGGVEVSATGMCPSLARAVPAPGVSSSVMSPMGLRRVIAAVVPVGTVTPCCRSNVTRANPFGNRTTFVTVPTGTPRMVTSFRGFNPVASTKSAVSVEPAPRCTTSPDPMRTRRIASPTNAATLIRVRRLIIAAPHADRIRACASLQAPPGRVVRVRPRGHLDAVTEAVVVAVRVERVGRVRVHFRAVGEPIAVAVGGPRTGRSGPSGPSERP